MNKYRYDKKYFDTQGLLKYMCFRWKWLVLIVLFCGCFFGIKSYLQQNNAYHKALEQIENGDQNAVATINDIELTVAKKYLNDKAAMYAQLEYNQNSILMQINPDDECVSLLKYKLVGKESGFDYSKITSEIVNSWKIDELLGGLSQQISEKFAIAIPTQYLVEMLLWDNSENDSLYLYVMSPSQDMSAFIAEHVDQQIKTSMQTLLKGDNEGVQIKQEPIYTYSVRDTGLRNRQIENENTANKYAADVAWQDESMDSNVKKYIKQYEKYVEKTGDTTFEIGQPIAYEKEIEIPSISKKVALLEAAIGLLKGVVIGIVVLIFIYLFTPFIWTGKNVEESFGLLFWGEISGRKKSITSQQLQYLIQSYDKKEKTEVCVLTDDEKNLSDITEELKKLVQDSNLKLSAHVLGKIIEDNRANEILEAADLIVMSSVPGKIKYTQFEKNMSMLVPYQEKVKGFILFDK